MLKILRGMCHIFFHKLFLDCFLIVIIQIFQRVFKLTFNTPHITHTKKTTLFLILTCTLMGSFLLISHVSHTAYIQILLCHFPMQRSNFRYLDHLKDN